MSSKTRYRSLCANEPTIPLFLRDWWLDATCGDDRWDVAVIEADGRIIGALPYHPRRRFGLTLLTQPPLTQFLGPWIAPLAGGHSSRLSVQKERYGALIGALPPFDRFAQNMSTEITNWLPFYWRGFAQTTRYTYVIPLHAEYVPLNGFASNMRNKARKARKQVAVRDDGGADLLFNLCAMTFARQGLAVPFSRDLVGRICAALIERDRGRIFVAEDGQGRPHSCLLLAWDDRRAYVHMVGEDPELRRSGAGILLVEHAIDYAVSRGLEWFDFEGSMIEAVEIVRRSCGGQQTPYSRITKTPSCLLRLSEMLQGLRSPH